MDADSLRGIPVAIPPVSPFIPSPAPSGDTCDDVGLFLDPITLTLNWKKTPIACGPSALAVNMALSGGVDNLLASVPGADGMRGGLAAYIPRGVWNVYGSVVLAAKSGVLYTVHVWQGHNLGSRPGIVSENAQIVGGGCGAWPGGDNGIFTIPFSAHMIQFAGDETQANEILVSVYPSCAGDGGAALATVGSGPASLPANFASQLMIYRVRGI